MGAHTHSNVPPLILELIFAVSRADKGATTNSPLASNARVFIHHSFLTISVTTMRLKEAIQKFLSRNRTPAHHPLPHAAPAVRGPFVTEHAIEHRSTSKRRSSLNLGTAHQKLSTILDTSSLNNIEERTHKLGTQVLLTGAPIVHALFFDVLAPRGLAYLIVPLLAGILESTRDTHSLAVLSDVLFDFMIPVYEAAPTLGIGFHAMIKSLAKTLEDRIQAGKLETPQALESARANILPHLYDYRSGAYKNTIRFKMPVV